MNISEKVKEIKFSAGTTKEAYLKCCKWISTNIVAKNNSDYITYKVSKVGDVRYKQDVLLEIFVTVDEQEIQERNCSICQEMSDSFFMSKNKYLCETCKLKPYRKRLYGRLQDIEKGLKGKVL